MIDEVAAPDHADALPVRRLPHCPNQVFLPCDDRWEGQRLQGLCACPEPDADSDTFAGWPRTFFHRVHWVTHVGVPSYCHCGPSENPPGSGEWSGVNPDGYVCDACRPLLLTTRQYQVLESHRLRCDSRCCYCGNVAKRGHGWRLYGHPAMAAKLTYTVAVKPWSGGLELHIDGVGVTQALGMDDAEEMARDLIRRRTGTEAIELEWVSVDGGATTS